MTVAGSSICFTGPRVAHPDGQANQGPSALGSLPM
jgi:hypothetical protein